MEDPTPPVETPRKSVVGGLKTRLFEGSKSIGSLWAFNFLDSKIHLRRWFFLDLKTFNFLDL